MCKPPVPAVPRANVLVVEIDLATSRENAAAYVPFNCVHTIYARFVPADTARSRQGHFKDGQLMLVREQTV